MEPLQGDLEQLKRRLITQRMNERIFPNSSAG